MNDRVFMEQQAAARLLWHDILRQAEKDRQYFRETAEIDFAGKFREFNKFFLWLWLHGYKPGMEITKENPHEPWGPRNCKLYEGRGHAELSDQIEKLAEFESKRPSNAPIIIDGMTLSEIGMKYGIPKSTLMYRYREMGMRTLADITEWQCDKRATVVEGKTLHEIAAQTGCPVSTIRYRHSQGIRDIESLATPAHERRKFCNPDGTPCEINSDTNRRLFAVFNGIKDRCYKKSASGYYAYGGRGIKMCDEWRGNYPAFRQWAMHHGYAIGLTIERIDPNKDYCPENCRWATWTEQACNKQHSIYTVLRVRAGEACEYLAKYPKHGIVTIIVRNDIMPPDPPEQCDYEI